MRFELYTDAALARDIPEHGLCRGDVVKIVDHHQSARSVQRARRYHRRHGRARIRAGTASQKRSAQRARIECRTVESHQFTIH